MTREQLPISEIITSKWYIEIKRTIISFCKFIESQPELTGPPYLERLREHLELLYQAGRNLSWVDLKSDVHFQLFIDEVEYQEILNRLSEKLGDSRFYWRTFNPTEESDKHPICEDLVDDVGDIYKDLKNSILILERNTEESAENALWQIKFDFSSHWGDHCINALYGIHYFLKK